MFFQPRKTLKTRKKAGVVTRGLVVLMPGGQTQELPGPAGPRETVFARVQRPEWADTVAAGSQRSVAVFQVLNVSARPGLFIFSGSEPGPVGPRQILYRPVWA